MWTILVVDQIAILDSLRQIQRSNSSVEIVAHVSLSFRLPTELRFGNTEPVPHSLYLVI